MNADLSRPSFAERELPAGRHQFHKERLMAQIHEDLRAADAEAATPIRTAGSRNPFLRSSILVPAAGFALAGALAAGFFTYVDQGAPDGTDSTVATGPALTTRIGAADPGARRSSWTASPSPPPPPPRTPPAGRCVRTSSSTSEARRPPPT